MIWRREKSVASARILTTDYPACNLQLPQVL